MFDLWARDTGIAALFLGFAVLIILPVQLALCFRARKRFVKLLPAVLLAVATVVLYLMAISAKDWSAFAYLIFAALSGVSLVFDGIAWGVWWIVKLAGKKHTAKSC